MILTRVALAPEGMNVYVMYLLLSNITQKNFSSSNLKSFLGKNLRA